MKDTLLILTPGFPENEADSACIPPQQVFVRALKTYYPQLDIIVLSFQYPFTKIAYSWYDIPVISFGGKEKGGLSRRFLWRRVNKKLEQLHKEKNIKGVLSFWCGECALLGNQFARKYGIRHFTWILGQDAKKENRYIKRMHPKADELVALSDFIQDEFQKNHTVRPLYMVPPGIDSRLFGKPTAQRDIDILAAGSLIPLKQYDVFIEVVAELKKTMPGIKSVLAGKGPEKEKLEQLIKKFELQNNITLTGGLAHREVLALMQRAKVFLHPSAYEGFGVVCIEALYAGASVISFCQPMKEPITGWYIVGTREMMVEKAQELLSTSLLHDAVMPYPIEESVKKMMQLFNQVAFG